MEENLSVKIDSKEGQRDLVALSTALDKVASSSRKMGKDLNKAASEIDGSLTRASKSMGKYAEVTALLNKIKIVGNPAVQIKELGNAIDALGRAKMISDSKVSTLREFAKAIQTIKSPGNLSGIAASINALGTAKYPTSSQVKNLQSAFRVISSYKGTTASTAGMSRLLTVMQTMKAPSASAVKNMRSALNVVAGWQGKVAPTASMERMFQMMANIKAPSKTAIDRIQNMLLVLQSAKAVPNAGAIARDLDMIAASAARAGAALNTLPARIRNLGASQAKLGSTASSAARQVVAHNAAINQVAPATNRALKGTVSLSNGLGGLSSRFRLSYQAGTLFSAMFSAFTIGRFVKGVFDAAVQMQKLEKAMFFVTGSFDSARKASVEFLSISNELGTRALANSDAYSRFAVSSAAVGASLKEVNDIYRSASLALVAVGASTQQQEYAFYGLSQAMSKGKIMSEEFNRQIGEQIPGNVAAGVKALSAMTGKMMTANDLFNQMKTGTLQSLPFLKEWSKAITEMFQPLLPIAALRPDFQLNRLINVYDRFKFAVGNSEFVKELTSQMKKLADSFITGTGEGSKLSDQGEKLANKLGHNMASIVHALGEAIQFLVNNMDSVIATIKGLLALSVAKTFASWGSSAVNYTRNLIAVKQAAIAAAVASGSAGTATGVGGAASAAANIPYAATMSGIMARRNAMGNSPRNYTGSGFGPMMFNVPSSQSFGRRTNAIPRTRIPFGRRSPVALAGANVGATAASSALSSATSAAGKGIGALAAIMPGLGTIAISAAVALAMLSDKLTDLKTSAGNQVNVGDVVSGFTSNLGDSIRDFLSDSTKGFVEFKSNGEFIRILLVSIGASLKTVFGGLFYIADTLGRFVGTVVASIGSIILRLGAAIVAAGSLRFGTAKEILAGTASDIGGQWKSFGQKAVQGAEIFNVNKNAHDIMNGAAQSADARGNPQQESELAETQMEAARKQQMAADANLRAATSMRDVFADLQAEKTTPEEIIARMKALYDGSYGKQFTPKSILPDNGGPQLRGSDLSPAKALAPSSSKAEAANGAEFMRLASLNLGKNEHTDRKSLSEFFAVGGAASLDPEKTAWCAAFVNAVLGSNGFKGTGSNAASSFQDIGKAVSTPQPGDIVLIKGGDSGINHVGFFKGTNANGSVDVLGGNQGANGEVNVSTFKASAIAGYRRPNEIGTNTEDAAHDVSAQLNKTTEAQAEAMGKSQLNLQRQLQSVFAGSSPIAAAQSEYQSKKLKLAQITSAMESLSQRSNGKMNGGLSADVIESTLKTLEHYADELKKALNPMGEFNRLEEQSIAVEKMRAAGLGDQADYQEHINELVEKGYTLSQADLAVEKKRFLQNKDTLRQLTAEVDLRKTLNDVNLQRMNRQSNSPVDVMVNEAVGARANEDNVSLETARARMQKDGTLGYARQSAQAVGRERSDSAQQFMSESIGELTATYGLNPTAKSLRDDYKKALQDMTGLSTDSLSRLEAAASASQKSFASQYAETKHELENPPGFQRWVDGLEPVAERLEQIKATFAEDLSQGITDSLMGDKVDWSAMAKNVTKQLTKMKVDETLAGVYKSLGIVKAQTPQEQQANAASVMDQSAQTLDTSTKTFDVSTNTFSVAVDNFSSAVAQGSAASQAASNAASGGTSPQDAVKSMTSALDGLGNSGGNGTSSLMSSLGFGNGAPDIQPYSDDALRALNPISNSDLKLSMPTLNLGSQSSPGFLDRMWSGSDGTGGVSGFFGNLFGGASGGSGGSSGGFLGGLLGGGSGGIMGLLGGLAGPLLGGLFGGDEKKPEPNFHFPNGVLGEMSQNVVNGTLIPAHENQTGAIISMIGQTLLSAYGSGMFSGGNIMGSLGFGKGGGSVSPYSNSYLSSFNTFDPSSLQMRMPSFMEGGFTTSPVASVSAGAINWATVPHYAEGTGNTSKGIPAMVHPDEAIIPLSRNRAVPVEMSGGGGATNITSNITVVAPDPNTFREARGSIQREQNRSLRRSAMRNLTSISF